MELKLTAKLVADLGFGYLSGKNIVELSKEFNLAPATVARGLRKYGIKPEREDQLFTVKQLTDEQKSKLIADFQAGHTLTKIGEDHDINYPILVKILEEAGLYKKHVTAATISKVIKVGDTVKRLLNAIEQKQLCEKYIDGPETIQDLATDYGIHVDTVKAILRRNNSPVKRYILEEVVDMFCEEFKNKTMNVYDIAKVYQLDPSTVKYWLTKRGLIDITNSVPIEDENPLTRAELKRLARARSLKNHLKLIEIIDNPQSDPKTVVVAIKLMNETGYGKPRDEPEEEEEQITTADKVLGMINTNLFKK